jgi:hypothetical protein
MHHILQQWAGSALQTKDAAKRELKAAALNQKVQT